MKVTNKWLRDTIARIVEDNVHHGIEGLWADREDGTAIEPDDPDIQARYEALEKAAKRIRSIGRVH